MINLRPWNAPLETPPPRISVADAQQLADERFGVRAKARLLTSERDQNFYMLSEDGAEYVLKLSNLAEDPGVVAFQNAALDHIARVDPNLPTPRVIRALDGEPSTLFRAQIVRLLTWLPGNLMNQHARTSGLRRELGVLHARLGLALRSFEHPAAAHELMWDLQHADRLAGLLCWIEDPGRRALVEQGLSSFTERVAPALPKLRAQVIHNDLNPHNVVVCAEDPGRVCGLLDFGDMVRAPLVCDVAVAASYHVRADNNPLADVTEYVSAYRAVSPLHDEEFKLLTDLVVTRLAMTVLITSWRAVQYPDNRDYILRNAPHAWRGLEAIAAHRDV